MRLELRPAGAEHSVTAAPTWYLERGRRTLGRSPGCDWRLPESQRSVSSIHCTIESDGGGFLLRDRSANGSRVDDVTVHEGETARLSDQSRLEIGGLRFLVRITGTEAVDMPDPDAKLAISDEPLTISAILADIAPGGRTATGILGARNSHDWSDIVGERERPSPSRNVEIGWGGPPETRHDGKLLPEDWNLEGDGGSDYGSHLEHGAATRTVVPIQKPRPASFETVNDNSPPDADAPAWGALTIGERSDLPERPAGDGGGDLAVALAPLLQAIEQGLERSWAAFDLPSDPGETTASLSGRSQDAALTGRLQAIAERQTELAAALESLARAAGSMMEPRMIEARVDAARPGFWVTIRRWASGQRRSGSDGAYWQAYRAQFEKHGRELTVRAIFRDAMLSALNARRRPQLSDRQQGRYHDEE